MAFLDNNANKGDSVLLIAVNLTSALIGPLIGYQMAHIFLEKWINFYFEEAPVEIDPRGSQWVGAWWLGYIVVIVMITCVSWPLLCFPRQLRSNAKTEENESRLGNQMNKKFLTSIQFVTENLSSKNL